jgi:hypothetical protein
MSRMILGRAALSDAASANGLETGKRRRRHE